MSASSASPFAHEALNELHQFAQQRRAGATQRGAGATAAEWVQIKLAAEDVLRDPALLDPRHRDPLSPPAGRRAAVIRALTAAIGVEIRRQREQPGAASHHPRGPRAALALLESPEEATLIRLYDETIGWGSVQRDLDLAETTEVKFIGAQVQVYAAGQPPVTYPNPLPPDEVERRARILAQDANEPLNSLECQRSLALPGGTRVTMTVPPLAASPLLIFRRGRQAPWTLADLVERGTLSQEVADLLRFCVRARLGVLVAGATGSGKTALLETLLQEIDGHVVTIEDGAQELQLEPARLWTALTVDAVKDSDALSAAAQNALRQTPEGVGIGECRGREAGAILALATSDHLVMTTIHAEDAPGALRRFAARAATAGAESYAGRFEDALRDAIGAFSLVVVIQYWGEIGRRIVTQVALACDVGRDASGGLQAAMIPLATASVCPTTRDVGWTLHARPGDDGEPLVFADPATALPRQVAARIRSGLHRAWGAGHTGQSAHARMEAALRRGYAALDGARFPLALAETRAAWNIKRDASRILPLVQDALTRLPHEAAAIQRESAGAYKRLKRAMIQGHWELALSILRTIEADPALLASPPEHAPGGWPSLRERIGLGMDQVLAFDQLLARIPARIAAGAARETLTALDGLASELLDFGRQRQRLAARVDLIEALARAGQSDPAALAVVREQLMAFEDQHSAEETGDADN